MINIFTVSKKITRNGILIPNFYFDSDKFATVLEFINQQKQQNLAVIFRMYLKQFKMVENQISSPMKIK